jgi:phosphoribosylamine---glycine ligase
MNILFISKDGNAVDLARKLKEEGHDVKLFIEKKRAKKIFGFIVEKIEDWKSELHWVGKDGLIFFDDSVYGKIQDKLRKKGFNVFGGCEIADKIEYDREFTYRILKKYGVKTSKIKTFNNMIEAAEYASEKPKAWVIKREGDNSKFVSYVGHDKDGKDVIELLKNYSILKGVNKEPVSLQERIDGIEIGVGRFFNGTNWVGPIEINIEHPHLFSGNVGQFTSEMGTLAWYTDKENRLYKETLKKLEPFLKEIKYKGDFAINCIVNNKNAFALELTPRIGTPIIHLQKEIHKSSWGEFLLAIAKGENFDLEWKKGFGIVITIAVPPFPFQKYFPTEVCHGLTLDLNNCSKEDLNHIHLEEVSKRPNNNDYYISGYDGYICYTTSLATTIHESNNRALAIAKKIHAPKIFFRNDIGLKFEKEDLPKLKKWGWL